MLKFVAMLHKNYLILISLLILHLFFSCNNTSNFKTQSYEKIESITQSNIKRMDEIIIVFQENIKYKDKVQKAIVFSPSLNGTYHFTDDKTFVFTPSSPYDGGSEIKMTCDIGLLTEGKKGEQGFVKNFVVFPPSIVIETKPLKAGKDKDSVEIEGSIETDIPYNEEDLKKIFTVKKEDKTIEDIKLEVVKGKIPTSYSFSIKGIKRENKDVNYTVFYDGSSFGAMLDDFENYRVVAKDNFEVISHRVEDGNTVNVHFSDNLAKDQLISTLVTIDSDTRFTAYLFIEENRIRIYNNLGYWPDNCKINILKGVESDNGNVLKNDYSFVIKNSYDVPRVKFETHGNIVPSKDNATVLIKTRNVKGVMLRAINVYGKNMLQFLQNDNLGEEHYLEPVGEPVWEGRFQFEWKEDMKNRDVVRAIDITELVKKFPTGMFNLQLAFSKEDSVYVPNNTQQDFSHLPFPPPKFYLSSWKQQEDYWDTNRGKVSQNGFWRHYDNPSHPAFYLTSYNSELVAKKDILVSNISLMAKKDVNNSIYARVCDIRTGKSVEGAKVKVFTFAQREIQSSVTDKDGSVFFEKTKDAHFIQAENEGSFAYLKLNSGNEIETGHFEVDGEVSKEGIKGYIYGERNIWRPGDAIHLSFILQDVNETLPKDIPVEFTLLDPLYTEVDRNVFTSSIGGIYRMDTKTLPNAKTGSYTARVKIGGNVWSKAIKVESIIPNRLFLELTPQSSLKSGDNNFVLLSEWLHGAKASGLKAELDLNYSIKTSPFKEWKNYSFIADYARYKFSVATENAWHGVLDEEGKAYLKLPMNVKDAPGKLKATFKTRVYEGSGAFSEENKTFDFSPYPCYVGIMLPLGEDSYRERMLYTNKEHEVNIVVVDDDGKLIKKERKCSVELYKLEWRWWWEHDAYAESLYSSSSSIKPVLSSNVITKNGKAIWNFNIKDEDWGRYLLIVKDDEGGHSSSSIVYVDTPYWSRRDSRNVGIAETILQMQAGKERYKVGEEVEVTFPSSSSSFAYVTLEKSGKVIERKIIEGTGGTLKYKFKAKENMAPNVYVHVSLVQPYKNVKNSLPIRLYGILPISVENELTHLEPVILADKTFESSKKASFKVKEQNGRSMAFTVAVVDEGLLGLTGFTQPNPWNYFYRKEASSLLSYDMFNSISGAFAGRIESLLAIGGSSDVSSTEGSKKAERFKSVAMLLGPYQIKEGEEKKIEFEMPQYMGAVRLMVVASSGVSYGVKEKSVKVTSPLIVLPTFPRVLGIGENMEVPITVFNGTDALSSIKVSLKSEGAINIKEEKTLKVGAMKNEIVSFNVKAEKKGKSVFTIEGMGLKNIKDTTKVEIDSISRGTPYVNVETLLLKGGEEKEIEIELLGEKDSRELFLEASRMPSLGLENRLSYLLNYHSSCLEQITSKAFSQLYLQTFLELDSKDIEKRKDNINNALKMFSSFQLANGGFSYWTGGKNEALWASIYAGHFMSEAKKMGFEVEETLYKKFLAHEVELAKNWTVGFKNDPEIQAYRLYVLALSGVGDLQSMNKLKAVKDISPISKTLLASSYIILGKKDVGKNLLEGVDLSFVSNKQGLKNYGSTVRDVAMKLHAYTLLEEKGEHVNDAVFALANVSCSDDYLSTNEIAWLLIAMSPYYNYKKASSLVYDIVTKNEKQEINLNMTSKVTKLKVSDEKLQVVRVKNKNKENMYFSFTAKSILPVGEEKSDAKEGLRLSVKYTNLNMEPIVNPKNIKKGERFLIFILAENNSYVKLDDLILTLPIPTGWELTNRRLSDGDQNKVHSSEYDYQDIKDTQVNTYFSLSHGEEKNFVFEGTAVYEGEYYIPSIVMESMYNPNYRVLLKN